MFSIENGLEPQKMRRIVEISVFILETVIHSGSNKLHSAQVCKKLFQPNFNLKSIQFTIYNLHFTIYNLQFTIYNLQFINYFSAY